MSFSDRLKKLRGERNVSQKEVAEFIGISDVMVSMYEQGKKQPSVDKLEKLATYYGVTSDYLLGTDSSVDELETVFPEGVKVLRRASKELTPEAKDQMIKLMRAFLEK